MAPQTFHFCDFELDSAGFDLRRQGRRIRLERKPMELLILLVEKRGQLVSREEILERVWGRGFFFDAERGINNAVRKIRATLNDDAEQPRFVETVVGKGYRFIALVEPALQPRSTTVPASIVHGENSHWFRWRLTWIPALAVALFVTITFVFDIGGIRHRIFAPGAPPIHSIAVLPLENLSGDANQEYFADGMTDALITDLAQISSLRVISRTSAMHYKGSHQPLPEIAKELNVDAVVEGSVIRSGDRVRITAQLLDARSDRHLWARAYDRDVREIVSLQQDVADSIVHEIQPKLTPQENLRLGQYRQVDPEVYDNYLHGMYFWQKFNEASTKRAIEYFEKSLRGDPSYPLAYAGLANAYSYFEMATSDRPKEVMPKAKEAAEKALQLDSTLADAHSALGWVNWIYDWDWVGAEREFRRAIQLNPGHTTSHEIYANFLSSMGRFEEASREFQIARELDPVSIILVSNTADHFRIMRQYDKAIAENRRALDMDPGFVEAHFSLALAYRAKGMKKECIAELEQVAIGDGEPNLADAMKMAYMRGGYKSALKSRLKYYQDRRSAGSYAPFEEEAWAYAILGNKDLALQALEKAFVERDPIVFLSVDPEWDTIRADPRFRDLVGRVGTAMNTGAGVVAH